MKVKHVVGIADGQTEREGNSFCEEREKFYENVPLFYDLTLVSEEISRAQLIIAACKNDTKLLFLFHVTTTSSVCYQCALFRTSYETEENL